MLRVKELRKRDNMSQEALAGKMGVSRSAVAMWEAGRSEPDNDKLVALAALFRVSVDELLGREAPDAAPLPRMHGRAAPEGCDQPDAAGADAREPKQEDDDIRLIERARRAMSLVEKDRMMKILKASFEEYFSDEDK